MQKITIADREKRVTLKDFKDEIKAEQARLYNRASNLIFNFLAPKDYTLKLTKKQAIDLLTQMEHGIKGQTLAVFYDDNNDGVIITKDFCEQKTKKTIYWIHG